MYHPTTPISDSDHLAAISVSEKQDNRIYDKLKEGGEWTCWKLSELFPDILITSIRRSLNTLESHGKIERVGYVKGRFNRECGVYRAIKELKLF